MTESVAVAASQATPWRTDLKVTGVWALLAHFATALVLHVLSPLLAATAGT